MKSKPQLWFGYYYCNDLKGFHSVSTTVAPHAQLHVEDRCEISATASVPPWSRPGQLGSITSTYNKHGLGPRVTGICFLLFTSKDGLRPVLGANGDYYEKAFLLVTIIALGL